jgi:ankyrin repeat protein
VPTVPTDHPVAVEVVLAIRAGDVPTLKRLLDANPGLATWTVGPEGDATPRSLLHVVTDWPGHVPNGATTVEVLVHAGADVNADYLGPNEEAPLHWAASSDDVEVLDALLDAGADIERRGAVIAGGTAIADATAFGQWNAARRLVERGASTNLWESATLGLQDRVAARLAADPPPDPEEVTSALWGACHGGQLGTAHFLLNHGADINWIGWDDLTPMDAARRSDALDVVEWLVTQGAKTATEVS